jgi:hypothetical protein
MVERIAWIDALAQRRGSALRKVRVRFNNGGSAAVLPHRMTTTITAFTTCASIEPRTKPSTSSSSRERAVWQNVFAVDRTEMPSRRFAGRPKQPPRLSRFTCASIGLNHSRDRESDGLRRRSWAPRCMCGRSGAYRLLAGRDMAATIRITVVGACDGAAVGR